MAGVKGRSGGARPNSGGFRDGAGRKPNAWYWDQGMVSPGGRPAPDGWQRGAAECGGAHRARPVSIEPGDRPCFVYVIYEAEEPGICKIGVATDVAHRLQTMQVGTWRTLRLGHAIKMPSKSAAHAVERQVHQALRGVHLRGEWFVAAADKAAAEVDAAVEQLRALFSAAIKACAF